MTLDHLHSHSLIRETKTWRSYGIDGKGPIRDTLIQDLEGEHLLNIIRHLEERKHSDPLVLANMYNEITWRLIEIWAIP